jgi:hypothetical protein
MSSLWIPPGEANRVMEQRRVDEARLLQNVEQTERFRFWNRELKQIDPYVEIIKAPENATYPGLKPGYYHILRRPPAGIPTLIAHEGPNGEFRDLDSGVFKTLRDGDMWNAERERDRKKRIREAEKAQERAEEREREDRIEEVMDRYNARFRPSVSMAGSWTNRAGARKG